MNSFIPLAKDWLPPALWRILGRLRGNRVRYIGDYRSWEEAALHCKGYDARIILEKVLDATIKVKCGEAVFERDSVFFDEIQYSWPVTAALMWAAARNGGELNVLDFGGSLGSSYFQNRKFLTHLKTVSWHVVEQPHFVESGRNLIQNDVLRFYISIEESLKSLQPNVVLLSSVAQYLPNLNWLFDQINSIDADILIFDRTPFSDTNKDSVCIQLVPNGIYNASYPMRIISKNKMLSNLNRWKIIEGFSCPEGRVLSEAGLEFEFTGHIFERIHDKQIA